MKKLSKLLFFILCVVTMELNSQDTIHWRPGYRLNWQDFQGLPDTSSKFGAVTNASLMYYLNADHDTFYVSVLCYFTRTASWSKFKNDTTLLDHEQGHFDIAQIFARRLKKQLRAYTFNYKTIGADVDKIFQSISKAREAMDKIYDDETDFSRARPKQLQWTAKIARELQSLEQFKLR